MEYLVKNPVIGALLNCIAFGLADLYVGHFAAAIFKLAAYIFIYYWVINLLQYLSQYYPLDRLAILAQCIYIPFTVIMGYRTVLKSRREQTPSN